MVENEEQRKEIERYYMETYRGLLRLAKESLYGNADLAEETVQEVFVIACSRAEAFLSSDSPKGWLVLTLRNVIKKKKRALARMNKYLISSMSPDDMEISAAEDPRITEIDFTTGLTEEDQLLIRLRYFQYKSTEEIAKILNITPASCRQRLSRLMKKLNDEK